MNKRIPALVLAAVMAMSAAGCGSKTATNTDATANTDTAQNTATAADNDLVIAFNTDVQSLDPHNTTDTLSISISNTMYESLIKFDENQNIVPHLAESFKAEDDNLTYTFTLRQGVKFSDGTDFNADAVIANYERCLADTTLRQNSNVKKWESVTKVDDYTVAVKLLTPDSSFLNRFTQFDIISPTALANGVDLNKESAGTGQYVFKEHVEGDHVTVVPNTEYWGTKATVDSLTFRAVPEDGSRIAMLQTGEADFIHPMPVIQAQDMNGQDGIVVGTVTFGWGTDLFSEERVIATMNGVPFGADVSEDGNT